MYDSVGIFLITCLQIPADWSLPNGYKSAGVVPWGNGGGGSSALGRNASGQAAGMGVDSEEEGSLTLDDVLALSLLESDALDVNSPLPASSSPSHMSQQSTQLSIGMTNERQADVRGKLFALMGNSSGNIAAAASSSSSSSSSSSFSPPLPPAAATSPQTSDSREKGDSDFQQGWACQICTLVNNSALNHCAACGTDRS